MFFTEMCPSAGTRYVSFELFLSILREPGEGRRGAPGTVHLQNPEVTSRKACLRNADLRGNCSEKLVQMNVSIWAGFFSGGFSSSEDFLESGPPPHSL